MTNPTIIRLDRAADRLGLRLDSYGPNTRSFAYLGDGDANRLIKYRPGGKGVIRVQSFIGSLLDTEVVVSIERMERLMRSAV